MYVAIDDHSGSASVSLMEDGNSRECHQTLNK